MAPASTAGLRGAFYVPPLKSSEPTGISEAIDWHAGLTMIRDALPPGAGQPSAADTNRLAECLREGRAAAIRAHEANASSEVIARGAHALVSYLALIERFERAAGAAAVREAGASKLHFVWRNAFAFVERREHGGSLEFERLGVMFNLGVVLMGYSTREDVGIQPAAVALQCAAGAFQAAKEHASRILDVATTGQPLHDDVLPPCLRALELLALGQAQCCFALHAAAAGTGAAVQSKLWGQAALDLREAVDLLPRCASGAPRAHVEALASACLAQAHVSMGAVRRAERKHGLAVSHLAFALEQLGKASASAPRTAANLSEQLRALAKPVEVDYEVARRDNDNVYFEREVPFAELTSSIECKCMVTAMPPLANFTRALGVAPQSESHDDAALAGWESAALRRQADAVTAPAGLDSDAQTAGDTAGAPAPTE